MNATISTNREELDQLGWREAVVRATPEALSLRQSLLELPTVRGRVSVVTVCFNAAAVIVGSFRSVEAQTYKDLEYIVIDGKSNDGTLEQIANCTRIDLATSMPDKGIADAFNRGVSLATGEYIAFLNADDVWPADHITNAVAALEQDPSSAFVFGDLVRAEESLGKYYIMRGDEHYHAKLLGWPPEFNHPSFLTRHTVFEKVGLFDLSYRVCMDLEWLLRVDRARLQGRKVPGLWVVMRCGGVSDQLDRMFSDVRRVLLAAGVSRRRIDLLLARAWTKTFVRQGLNLIGAGKLADRIRQRLNRHFVASDPQLIELACQALRSTASSCGRR